MHVNAPLHLPVIGTFVGQDVAGPSEPPSCWLPPLPVAPPVPVEPPVPDAPPAPVVPAAPVAPPVPGEPPPVPEPSVVELLDEEQARLSTKRTVKRRWGMASYPGGFVGLSIPLHVSRLRGTRTPPAEMKRQTRRTWLQLSERPLLLPRFVLRFQNAEPDKNVPISFGSGRKSGGSRAARCLPTTGAIADRGDRSGAHLFRTGRHQECGGLSATTRPSADWWWAWGLGWASSPSSWSDTMPSKMRDPDPVRSQDEAARRGQALCATQFEQGMTRAIWTVLEAEPTAANATLPSGNALNDCQGWSGTAMLNEEPTAAPVLES